MDVRIVAATNKDLRVAIKDGTFRDDLFFRLNVVPIFVPPLRDRRQDIVMLAEHFLGEFAQEYGHRVKTLDHAALTILGSHDWPGNVRELRNVLERLAIMVTGETIGQDDLGFLSTGSHQRPAVPVEAALSLHEARENFERDYILRALVAEHGNISRTAHALGVERSNLYRKMRSFGIRTPRRTGPVEAPSRDRVDSRSPDSL